MDRPARADTDSRFFDIRLLSSTDCSTSWCPTSLSMFDRPHDNYTELGLRVVLRRNVNRWCRRRSNSIVHCELVMWLIWQFSRICRNDRFVEVVRYLLNVMEDHWQRRDFVVRHYNRRSPDRWERRRRANPTGDSSDASGFQWSLVFCLSLWIFYPVWLVES